jgi:hypothetical protein
MRRFAYPLLVFLAACGDHPDDPAIPKPLASVTASSIANSAVALCWLGTDGKAACMDTLNGSQAITPMSDLDGAASLVPGSSLEGLFAGGRLVASPGPTVLSSNAVQAAYALSGNISCWVGADGSAFCDHPTATTAIPLPMGTRAKKVAVSEDDLCVLLSDATVRCWAMQNGDWTIQGAGEPVVGVAGATDLALASYEFGSGAADAAPWGCAIVGGGQVLCWGDNTLGQLGIGSLGGMSASAVAVLDGDQGRQPLAGAVAIALGGGHSTAILADGSVHTWGQSVFATGSKQGVANRVGHLTRATAVGIGAWLDCALIAAQVVCWGGSHHVGPDWSFVSYLPN